VCVCGRSTLLLPFCLECSKSEQLEVQDEEDPDEVDIPEEPMQAAIYQQTGVVIHLRRRQLEELFREAAGLARKQGWQKVGALWWCTFLVRPGMMQWPVIPAATNVRMMFWLGDGSLGVVQRCVDPIHKIAQGLDVQALCSA